MRQIGTLPNKENADRLSDYLLTQGIETQVIPEGTGYSLWVLDEDRLAQAKHELDAFFQNPGDNRFRQATAQAQQIRRATLDSSSAVGEELTPPSIFTGIPFTIGMIAASVLVALATGLGSMRDSLVLRELAITNYLPEGDYIRFRPNLPAIREGQVWRVITPIFIHYGPIHLIFNGLLLFTLGGAVERSRGHWKFGLLCLLLAATSNLAEYYVDWKTPLKDGPALILDENPLFGGLSGVLYGLFGYAWVKSRYEPELGLVMPSETVLILLGWFVLCAIGVITPVANVAHAVGLLMGLIMGFLPQLWHRQ